MLSSLLDNTAVVIGSIKETSHALTRTQTAPDSGLRSVGQTYECAIKISQGYLAKDKYINHIRESGYFRITSVSGP